MRNPFSKWFTPPKLWDSKAVFPPYVSGLFYVIKGSLVPKLLEASYSVPLDHLEDVFIFGMVASQQLHTELYDIYGSRDPKFPWILYLLEYYFGRESVSKSIVYFHSDGDGRLMRRIFEDVERLKLRRDSSIRSLSCHVNFFLNERLTLDESYMSFNLYVYLSNLFMTCQ